MIKTGEDASHRTLVPLHDRSGSFPCLPAELRIGDEPEQERGQLTGLVDLDKALPIREHAGDLGEIEGMRPHDNGKLQGGRLQGIVPAHWDQAAAHESQIRGCVIQGKLAHAVTEIDRGLITGKEPLASPMQGKSEVPGYAVRFSEALRVPGNQDEQGIGVLFQNRGVRLQELFLFALTGARADPDKGTIAQMVPQLPSLLHLALVQAEVVLEVAADSGPARIAAQMEETIRIFVALCQHGHIAEEALHEPVDPLVGPEGGGRDPRVGQDYRDASFAALPEEIGPALVLHDDSQGGTCRIQEALDGKGEIQGEIAVKD